MEKTLKRESTEMDIADWRKKIDALDLKLVELINMRAEAAREIGKLKNNTNLPIYEPTREKLILENVRKANRGPLPDSEVQRVFERIIDVMRKLQQEEIHTQKTTAAGGETDLDVDVNE
ncbi:MAG TPA: chorismate mutase [Terriglobales bacterium]|nr:chorismate mutase [Terriglobales bacterium]